MPNVQTVRNTASNTTSKMTTGLLPWIVCFSAALYFFFEFMQVNLFNALLPSLFKAFEIDSVLMSKVWFCYNLANVLFLFVAGMILDRVSTRRLIILAMLVSVLCTFGMSFATAIWQIAALRFITGIAGAFCLLSCVRIASRWFPPRRMALVVGLIVTFAMFGGMLAQTPFTLLTDSIGWRHALLVDASVGAAMLFVIIAFVRDYPAGAKRDIEAQQHELSDLGFWKSLRMTVRNAQNWLGGLYTSLMNLPIFIFGAVWGSLYLVEIRGLSRADASLVVSMIFLGTMIGSPVMGWISDRIRQRRLPMILGAVVSIGIMMWLMYGTHLTLSTLMFIFFLLGFITSTQIISYPLIAESNPANLTGSAEGLASTLIMAGGFTTTMFAWAMNWHWNHKLIDSIPIYSSSDFLTALAILPVAFVLALLASLGLRETHCRAYSETSHEEGATSDDITPAESSHA